MTQQPEPDRRGSNAQKDPEDWKTGDEPMTGAQRSYLETLSTEAGEPFDELLTKADASKRIEELQRVTGRGRDASEAGDRTDPDRAEASLEFEDEAKQVAGGRAAADQERGAVQRAGEWTSEDAREVSKDD